METFDRFFEDHERVEFLRGYEVFRKAKGDPEDLILGSFRASSTDELKRFLSNLGIPLNEHAEILRSEGFMGARKFVRGEHEQLLWAEIDYSTGAPGWFRLEIRRTDLREAQLELLPLSMRLRIRRLWRAGLLVPEAG